MTVISTYCLLPESYLSTGAEQEPDTGLPSPRIHEEARVTDAASFLQFSLLMAYVALMFGLSRAVQSMLLPILGRNLCLEHCEMNGDCK